MEKWPSLREELERSWGSVWSVLSREVSVRVKVVGMATEEDDCSEREKGLGRLEVGLGAGLQNHEIHVYIGCVC